MPSERSAARSKREPTAEMVRSRPTLWCPPRTRGVPQTAVCAPLARTPPPTTSRALLRRTHAAEAGGAAHRKPGAGRRCRVGRPQGACPCLRNRRRRGATSEARAAARFGACGRVGEHLVLADGDEGGAAVLGAQVWALLGPPSAIVAVQLLAPVALHSALLLIQRALLLCVGRTQRPRER